MVRIYPYKLQYLNLMNEMVRLGYKPSGGSFWCNNPFTHNTSSLNCALHCHLWYMHMHGSSHGEILFSSGLLLKVPAFIRMLLWDLLVDTSSSMNFIKKILYCVFLLIKHVCVVVYNLRGHVTIYLILLSYLWNIL